MICHARIAAIMLALTRIIVSLICGITIAQYGRISKAPLIIYGRTLYTCGSRLPLFTVNQYTVRVKMNYVRCLSLMDIAYRNSPREVSIHRLCRPR